MYNMTDLWGDKQKKEEKKERVIDKIPFQLSDC